MWFFPLNSGYILASLLMFVFPLFPPSPSRLLLCNPACTEHRAANHHGDSGHPSHNAEPCVKWVTSHSSPEARASEAGAQKNPFSLCRIRVSEIRLPLAAWVPRLKVSLLKQSIWLTTKQNPQPRLLRSFGNGPIDFLLLFGFSDVSQCDPGCPRRPLHGSSNVAKNHTLTQLTAHTTALSGASEKHKEKKDQKPRRETCLLEVPLMRHQRRP